MSDIDALVADIREAIASGLICDMRRGKAALAELATRCKTAEAAEREEHEVTRLAYELIVSSLTERVQYLNPNTPHHDLKQHLAVGYLAQARQQLAELSTLNTLDSKLIVAEKPLVDDEPNYQSETGDV